MIARRALLAAVAGAALAVVAPLLPAYPLTLLTGRGSSSQWHTETRTSKSAVLRKLVPPVPYVEVHPDDATALGIGPTDWVRVSSRRGQIDVRALVTRTVPVGCVFIPMHFVQTNELTFPAFDPHSRQPAYKACAVKITPTLHDDPCVFDASIVDAIEGAARALDLPHMRLASGASHDANYLARVCPAGMIFVPCEKGISHNEAENAKPEDLAAGARVLVATLLDLANR